MSRRDDISRLYRIPGELSKIEKTLFIINSLIAVVTALGDGNLKSIATVFQIISALIFLIISVVNEDYFWYEAESARRKSAIESGFAISLSEYETEEYYNNMKRPSLERYATNLLESNYFSKEISGKMILLRTVKSLIAMTTLIFACRFVPNNDLLLVIVQAIFSAYVLQDTVRLITYKLKLDNLFKEGYSLIISPRTCKMAREAALIAYSVEYEAVKAHYKIRLDERLFYKYNEQLSNQWGELSHLKNQIHRADSLN